MGLRFDWIEPTRLTELVFRKREIRRRAWRAAPFSCSRKSWLVSGRSGPEKIRGQGPEISSGRKAFARPSAVMGAWNPASDVRRILPSTFPRLMRRGIVEHRLQQCDGAVTYGSQAALVIVFEEKGLEAKQVATGFRSLEGAPFLGFSWL